MFMVLENYTAHVMNNSTQIIVLYSNKKIYREIAAVYIKYTRVELINNIVLFFILLSSFFS